MESVAQRLYDACRAAFIPMGAAVSSQALQKVRYLMDSINSSDLGIDEKAFAQHDRGFGFFGMLNGKNGHHSSMVARWAPPISYLHIFDCNEFSIGVFCLPTSAVIPLHNHPNMIVLSKLLYGSMHVKAYDWVDPSAQTDALQPRLAKLVVDRVMTAPCETTALFPKSGGNIHAFTAIASCAVLDVLAPPYSAVDGRHCTYYQDVPYSSAGSLLKTNDNKQILAWLEEFQPPNDFVVKGAPYMGPRVVP